MTLNVAIAGAAGRTGRRIVAAAVVDRDVRPIAALESGTSPALGRDAGTVAGIEAIALPITSAAGEPFDVLIDFSTPAGTRAWLEVCASARAPMVIGTTGHEAADLDLVRAASEAIPIVKAPNMSLGVNVLLRLVRAAGHALAGWDVEIVETHHRSKADAPSGTALALGEALRSARAGREPTGRDEIGIHSVRIGGDPGEHAVRLASLHEALTLTHRATSRDAYAAGALAAARWVVARPPGLYDMQDVLGAAPS